MLWILLFLHAKGADALSAAWFLYESVESALEEPDTAHWFFVVPEAQDRIIGPVALFGDEPLFDDFRPDVLKSVEAQKSIWESDIHHAEALSKVW